MQAKSHGLPLTDFNYSVVTTSSGSLPPTTTSMPMLVGTSTTYLKAARSISSCQLSSPSTESDKQSPKV